MTKIPTTWLDVLYTCDGAAFILDLSMLILQMSEANFLL